MGILTKLDKKLSKGIKKINIMKNLFIDLIIIIEKKKREIKRLKHRNTLLKFYNQKAIIKLKTKNKLLEYKLKNYKKTIKKKDKKINYELLKIKDKTLYIKRKKPIKVIDKIRQLFQKPKYYIIYINQSTNVEILSIYKDEKEFITKKEFHQISKKVGIYRHKPCFLVHNDIVLSLEIKEDKFLWNAKEFYNIINHQIRKKLTMGDKTNIGDFIKQNWIMIVIIIVLILFLSSPYGKNFITQLMKDWKLSGTP